MLETSKGGSYASLTGWNPSNKALFTFDDASQVLSISPGMLRKLARTGRLTVTHIGRSPRISHDEVLRLCSGQSDGGVK
jgi:excisionase family DNA binding protein